jgi:peptide-methionine (R)-S-oxide reductase
MKIKLFVLLLIASFVSSQAQEKVKSDNSKVKKSEAQWKKELTPEQYEVLRNKGTERAFSGEYVNNFKKGVYVCAACNNLLFYSDAKFHSDCGWPSFDKAIKGSVTYIKDTSFGMLRTEVNCARCGGHLGHVFDDGPKETTGQRYCTNSVSVKFIPAKK